jgi:endonuclease YncB( thermonuclease family)
MVFLRSALILVLCLGAAPALAVTLTGTARVVDGDTIEMSGQTLRLIGIDAPELAQPCERDGKPWACGDWSRDALRTRLSGRDLSCSGTDQDRYGRWLVTCRLGGRDLGQVLVRDGVAFAYRRYSAIYVPDEAKAQRDRRGLWAGSTEAPEAFRHPDSAVPQGCALKGNVSASGTRIYHAPGQKDYAATRIDPAKGERWFCSAAEAKQAGWRAARR